MTFEIKDYFETPVILEPRVELYTVYDFMGKELPGLAIVLDMPIQGADEKEQFAILTKSFGEFIGLKNSAYVDINNRPFPFAPHLSSGILPESQDTDIKEREELLLPPLLLPVFCQKLCCSFLSQSLFPSL